jgi:hypothetical protein
MVVLAAGSAALARTGFDGIWSVAIITDSGACDRAYRAPVRIVNGQVASEGDQSKNTLATVMAIASQSLRNATDLEQGREAISHRLIALGRAHDLLLQTNWTSASLPAIVHAAIEPFDTHGAERFVVQGVEIDVGPAAVLSLAMALNELCTNAVKHGALSSAERSGTRSDAFLIHLGGGMGEGAALGRKVKGVRVFAEDSADYLELLITRYLQQRGSRTSFGEFVNGLDDEQLARFAAPVGGSR